MAIRKFPLPPGIDRNPTQYASAGRWYDCNNIRFRSNQIETIRGWVRDSTYELDGVGRRSFTSRDYLGNNYQFVGTDRKFYIIAGENPVDITPIREAKTRVNPGGNLLQMVLDGSSATALVKVTMSGHGLEANDWITFTDTFAGPSSPYTSALMTQNAGFQVFGVDDADNFTIYVVDSSTGLPVTGTGSATQFCTDYTIVKKISSGLSAQVQGQGWGAGFWGGDDYLPTVYTPTANNVASTNDNPVLVFTNTNQPTALAEGDLVYLRDLSGDIGTGIRLDGSTTVSSPFQLSSMNNHWWRVSSAPSVTSFEIDLRYHWGTFDGSSYSGDFAIMGAESGVGGSPTYYVYDDSASEVLGATRGWNDSSGDAEIVGELRRVYIDNYGEDIMLANSGGPIYYYDISANTSSGVPTEGDGSTFVAQKLSEFTGSVETPVVVDSFLISKKDGHCVALGCNDIGVNTGETNSMLVRWSDQNNPFDWGLSSTNTAGGQVLREGSRIVGGISTREEVLIFTDAAVYSMRFIGAPDTFGFNLVSSGVSVISANTAVNASNAVFFMGNDGFYVYTGQVQPLSSTVANYVFDDFNYDQKAKAFAAVNSKYSEVYFFYPSRNSFECDRYAVYNYEDRIWYLGSFDMATLTEGSASTTSYSRTSWRDTVVFENPMATYLVEYTPSTTTTPLITKTGVFTHESGFSANGMSISAYLKSGDIDISDGERFMMVNRVIPDFQVADASDSSTSSSVKLTLSCQDFPGESRVTTTGNVTTERDVNFTYDTGSNGRDATFRMGSGNSGNATAYRVRARAVSIMYSSENSDSIWRAGDIRFDVRPDGRR